MVGRSETFGPCYPLIVDSAFAGSFVAGLSLANLGGRLFWPSLSDQVTPTLPAMWDHALALASLLPLPSILTPTLAPQPQRQTVSAQT